MNLIKRCLDKIKTHFRESTSYRNKQTINGKRVIKHAVNIEYSNFPVGAPLNIGDTLTPIIYEYLKSKYNLLEKKQKKTIHLNMIGSIIGFKSYDAIIWGSGVLKESFEGKIKYRSKFVKYDIRAVRGPLTRKLLLRCGYSCPEIYGDPAILLPLIYSPLKKVKSYKISVVKHYNDKTVIPAGFHEISVVTDDYKKFIDEICASELVISSSLHGLIIAEAYGVPTIWFNPKGQDEFKYNDWYLSIGVENPQKIHSFSEISDKKNVGLENSISNLVEPLLKSFPFELWSNE